MVILSEVYLFGNYVDRLITMDVNMRGLVGGLYEAARNHVDGPLTYLATKALRDNVRSGDIVIIATGFPLRSWISPNIGESDGPPGAAVLARAIALGLEAVPILISEYGITNLLRANCSCTGIPIVNLEEAKKSIPIIKEAYSLPCQVIQGFPADVEEAKKEADRILNELKPTALISIERPGMNEKGVYHGTRGNNLEWGAGKLVAKVDYLFEEAKSRGILTIGVGDAGNEIGMGVIKDYIKETMPLGSKCICPCESGIAPITETDHLVVSAVSNWGAYGITACLAVLLEIPEILHSGEMEKDLLYACAHAGAFNGITCCAEPELIYGADVLPDFLHASIVEVLRMLGRNEIQRRKGVSWLDRWKRSKK